MARSTPPHRSRHGRSSRRAALFLVVLSSAPISAQEFPFQRDFPGASARSCPAFDASPSGSPEARSQAGQLASSAEQSLILGDLDRAAALLERATELDETSADLAYRHARVLEESGRPEEAVREYCRAIALAGEGVGARDARARLDGIAATERATLPEQALRAFENGLAAVDRGAYEQAAEAFREATDAAPLWAAAFYNRGLALDRAGRNAEAVSALLRYLELRPGAPDAIAVSQRVGQLQSLAIDTGPSPGAALTLGTLIPGMGQFYSGRPRGGFAVLAAAGWALAAGFLIEEVHVKCLNAVEPGASCPPDEVISRRTERPHQSLGIGVAAAVGVIAAIESFVHLKGRRSTARSFPAEDPGRTAASRPVLEGPSISTHSGTDRIDLNVLRLRFR